MARKSAGNPQSKAKQSKMKAEDPARKTKETTATTAGGDSKSDNGANASRPSSSSTTNTGTNNNNNNNNNNGGGGGGGGGVFGGSVKFRLMFLLIPLIQMLWTAEAPPRPFSAVRDRETGALVEGRRLIEPRVLVVLAHPEREDVRLVGNTVGLLQGGGGEVGSVGGRRVGEVWVMAVGGSAQGGEGRRRGWECAWDVWGVEKGKRVVLDAPELNASHDAVWDPNVIADTIRPFVLEHEIDTILTFDALNPTYPHHTAVSLGVTSLINSPSLSLSSSNPDRVQPRAYTLRTPSPFLNLGPLSPIIAHFELVYRALRTSSSSSSSSDAIRFASKSLGTLFISDIKTYIRAWRAILCFSWNADEDGLQTLRSMLMGVIGRDMWVNEWVEI